MSREIHTIVGLEIHVQLRTQTKLFCACRVCFDAPPNTCTCEVCLGHPGALPVLNLKAVEYSILTGLALNCEIAGHTKWDRKSYYYPDMPKNYQISQYDLPIARNGFFDFEVGGQTKRVRIRRAHLEEDAGKNIHDSGAGTLVDLNRAGTPLLEIVTEPDIGSPEEAYAFCLELQRLVRHLGVSEASMQKGQMRFEPNVNLAIHDASREVRTPIAEIKNINSFRFVRQAVEYEQARQLADWEQNPDYVVGKSPNENRGWNADRGITEYQRGKEAAHDYRYFPDPDLLPADISPDWLDTVRTQLPGLPVARRQRWITQCGISRDDAEIIVDERANADLFEAVLAAGAPADLAGKQFVNLWMKLGEASRAERAAELQPTPTEARAQWAKASRAREKIDEAAQPQPDEGDAGRVNAASMLPAPERIAELACITAEGLISRTAATPVAEAMLTSAESPRAIAERLGLIQERDAAPTRVWVEQAFAENAQAVQDALANPKKAKAAVGFLRGQVLRISGGKADPKLVGDLIEQGLDARRNAST